MHDAPSQKEMLTAVKAFIDDTAMPALKGHAAFHARVASNVLATVLRELEIRPAAESDEQQRLVALPDETFLCIDRDCGSTRDWRGSMGLEHIHLASPATGT